MLVIVTTTIFAYVYISIHVFPEKNILYTTGRILTLKNAYNFDFKIECKEIDFEFQTYHRDTSRPGKLQAYH